MCVDFVTVTVHERLPTIKNYAHAHSGVKLARETMENPPTSDPVPLSTSVLTTLLLQRLKHFHFDDLTLVATEVLLNMNILSETATVQAAPPERRLYLVC